MKDASPIATNPRVRLDAASKSRLAQVVAWEKKLSRLLMTYILSGLLFMLLLGTFLGVWNLILISCIRRCSLVVGRPLGDLGEILSGERP